MDAVFFIRSMIFLTAGLVVLLFPQQVLNMQSKVASYLVDNLHLGILRSMKNTPAEKTLRANKLTAIILIVISVGFFFVSIM